MTLKCQVPKQRLVFDCDGLLLDTEEIYFDIGKTIISKYGKEFTWEMKKSIMGLPWNESVDLLISMLDLPITREEYIREADYLHKLFINSNALPGVERLINHLSSKKIPIAVASSSRTHTFKLKTVNHQELFSKFDHCVLGDDPSVKRGKPAPDIFIEAINRLAPLIDKDVADEGPFPDVLAFEDSPVGVTAARAAGVDVIWIPDPRMDATLFQHDPHVHYHRSMEDFDPTAWGLPPFEDK